MSSFPPSKEQQQQPAQQPKGNPPGTTYEGLSYAPRQRSRPSHLALSSSPGTAGIAVPGGAGGGHGLGAPSSSSPGAASPSFPHSPRAFQSHSSMFNSSRDEASVSNGASASGPAISSSIPTRSSSSAALQPIESNLQATGGTPSSSSSQTVLTATAKARLRLQELKGRAQQLGLTPDSAGWLMIERLQAVPAVQQGQGQGQGSEASVPAPVGSDVHWAAVVELLGKGQCTLLLPTQPLEQRQNGITLAMLYDHTLLHANPLRPSPSNLTASSQVATLSGLRAAFLPAKKGERTGKLRLASFIARPELSFVSELQNERTRGEFLKSLPSLPFSNSADESEDDASAISLSTFEESFALPPAIVPRLQARPPPPRPRPSSTFASLFVGSGRAKQQAEQDREGVRDHVNVAPGPSSSAGTPPLAEGGGDREHPSEEAELTFGPERSIAVWIVDRFIRRSEILGNIGQNMQTRLTSRLSQAGIEEDIVDVVCSFATMFLPPRQAASRSLGLESALPSSASSTSLKGMGRSPTVPFLAASGAPYLSGPDELADNFQNFYSGVLAQLEGQLDREEAQTQPPQDVGASSNEEGPAEPKSTKEERVRAWMQLIETCVTEEVYDRLFAPFSSRDYFLDLALSSRIAALNLLGVTLSHLGLVLPPDSTDGGARIHRSLRQITSECGEILGRLNARESHSPAQKLHILTLAHTRVADGLAGLPGIQLKADGPDDSEHKEVPPTEDAQEDEGDTTMVGDEPTAKDSSEDEKPRQSTTASADLILPMLIYSIIRANTLHLASNLLFIQRYRADCLLNGQSSYCLVNMQAAVAFIENVEPAALGFDEVAADVLPSSQAPASPLHARDGSSASAVETLASPNLEQMSVSDRVRSRLASDFGDIAGVSNKVITGVLGSSLSAFGRIMSGTQNQGTVSENEREVPRTMDEFRERVQGQSSRRGVPIGAEDGEGRRSRKQSWVKEDDARSVRSATTARQRRATNGATDYGSAEEQAKDAYLSTNPNESKMSLGERLASLPVLGRFGMGERTISGSSPASITRELPGPPPPQKVAPPPEMKLPASLRSPYAPLKQPPEASRPLHIVLASTGSVASIKVPLMVEELLAYANVRIQVVATKASMHFYDRSALTDLNTATGEYKVQDLADENREAVRGVETDQKKLPRCHLWTDEDEWNQWEKVGDPILHIELRRWADVVLIAPCSADTLAKINGGICDGLLTSFLRALSSTTPTLLFPAMNTLMWVHPLTARQISFVKDVLGYEVHGPIEKRLACGDLGQGAMYEWTDIVDLVVKRFGLAPAEGHDETEPSRISAIPATATITSA